MKICCLHSVNVFHRLHIAALLNTICELCYQSSSLIYTTCLLANTPPPDLSLIMMISSNGNLKELLISVDSTMSGYCQRGHRAMRDRDGGFARSRQDLHGQEADEVS